MHSLGIHFILLVLNQLIYCELVILKREQREITPLNNSNYQVLPNTILFLNKCYNFFGLRAVKQIGRRERKALDEEIILK
ncbi:hypothetical protein HS7_13070 [Sulfolobales archaeon HS-7]|nr:hypothetical protein HS7_13070 [Sulfolobales archaeon HS-7]